MSAYRRFLEDGGYCNYGIDTCGFGGYGYDGCGTPFYGSGYGEFAGCLCHYCRVRNRCKYYRRRFRC